MTILLYDLYGAEKDRRFSPYCWRTKMALRHKGLDFETEPVRFGTMGDITQVPTLVDGDVTLTESFDIACYLEDAYPDRPSLFDGAAGRGEARFINAWSDTVMSPAMVWLYMLDIYAHLHPDDQAYFRQSREKRFGMTLEEFSAETEQKRAGIQKALTPLRTILATQDFICGDAPAYGDYAVFGPFASSRAITKSKLLEPDDPVYAWRARMLDLFDGYAGSATGYPV